MVLRYSRAAVGPFGRLFVSGNVNLLDPALDSVRFAVAGSRRGFPSESADWLKSQIQCLDPSRHVLVSGLALGSDSIAHRTALDCGIPQIAVLPSGFDYIVPYTNINLARDIVAAGGCLVSELPPKWAPSSRSYVSRNKIIAYLGHMLIVPHFKVKSGTRHTVDFAQRLNKYIITANIPASGNQFIINNSTYRTIVK